MKINDSTHNFLSLPGAEIHKGYWHNVLDVPWDRIWVNDILHAESMLRCHKCHLSQGFEIRVHFRSQKDSEQAVSWPATYHFSRTKFPDHAPPQHKCLTKQEALWSMRHSFHKTGCCMVYWLKQALHFHRPKPSMRLSWVHNLHIIF